LTGDRAFQRLRKGRTGGSQHLSVRLRPTRVGFVRVGFVVSRKVGKAVVRNRIRRRLREVLRAHLVASAAAGRRASYDLLVIVRPSAASAGFHELAAALLRALERALEKPGGSGRERSDGAGASSLAAPVASPRSAAHGGAA
jgi:ribonuclease P protein component